MFGMWWCLTMPWHKIIKCQPVSEISDKLTCSCGRAYGMNNHERIILPWDMVSGLYDDIARINAPVSGLKVEGE